MSRSLRQEIARETVEIVERGNYEVHGQRVDISAALHECLAATQYLTGDALNRLRRSVLAAQTEAFTTEVTVVNETTLCGLIRLSAQSNEPIAVLNFSSAKNPGGGFLNGSQAQEESLARSSALYASLQSKFDFYVHHRGLDSCLYTDSMILSPGCPVFRDDDGKFLPKPIRASFITSPAPNRGAVADNRPQELPLIPEVLRCRAELVLALAAGQRYSRLILGAWGCGVFRNDPTEVAEAFAFHLRGQWAGRFKQVLFSVLDTSPAKQTLAAFQSAFE